MRFLSSVLACVILASFGSLMLSGDGWLTTPRGRDYSLLTKYDPKLGQSVSVPQSAALGGKNLIVHLGDCSGCSINAFSPEHIAVGRSFDKVFLVYKRDRDVAVPAHLQDLPDHRWELVEDPDLELYNELNVAWLPRAYVLDRQGLVNWVAPAVDAWPPDVKRRRLEQ